MADEEEKPSKQITGPVIKAPKKSSPMQHTIAQQVAAAIATVTFYPFDVVKMRFMSQDGTATRNHNQRYYTSTFSALRCIREEEGLKTLFRGAHVSVLGVLVSWGVYMMLYRLLVDHFRDELSMAGFSSSALISVFASACSAFVGNPIWVIKTRMQLEAVSSNKTLHYATFRGGLTHAARTGAITSLWRGFSAAVLLSFPNSFLLPTYESFKGLRMKAKGKDTLTMPEICCCSVAAKTSIAVISHPIIVLKTRLQDERSRHGEVQYRNLPKTFMTTVQREGLHGLFRGLGPAMCQAIPRNLLQFTLYEAFLAYSKGQQTAQ